MVLPIGADILWWGLVVVMILVVGTLAVLFVLQRLATMRGSIKVGNVEYVGEVGLDVRQLIATAVDLEMRKHDLHHRWVDACRDKMRAASRTASQTLKNHVRVKIQDWYIERGETSTRYEEYRDYSALSKVNYYVMVEIGMNSVEMNGYAQKSESEFNILINEVFARIVQGLDAVLFDEWDDGNRIKASDIQEWCKPLHAQFRDQVRSVLLDCRYLAQQKDLEEARIQRAIDSVVSGGADTIENRGK